MIVREPAPNAEVAARAAPIAMNCRRFACIGPMVEKVAPVDLLRPAAKIVDSGAWGALLEKDRAPTRGTHRAHRDLLYGQRAAARARPAFSAGNAASVLARAGRRAGLGRALDRPRHRLLRPPPALRAARIFTAPHLFQPGRGRCA